MGLASKKIDNPKTQPIPKDIVYLVDFPIKSAWLAALFGFLEVLCLYHRDRNGCTFTLVNMNVKL